MLPCRTEPMSLQQLRIFLDGWFCGCGNPADAAGALLRLLRLHPLFDHRDEFNEWMTDDGLEMLLLYTLDSFHLTEHGGNVGGAWLTAKGEALRDALAAEEERDGFERLCVSWCIHGFDVDGPEGYDHDCMKADEPVSWEQANEWRR